ncbi:DNA-directed RNA polymerase subunit beta' [Cardinium endosymbiont of Oedothorax gibbosus]|uniref:DNA-directed RNA polymerase subunit beta' n=1 Tax=Cardinium endosymbiont of Oedothorax gibbosus TaxID=931101 RepID=UPI0020244984|nr:DNA-directed RNA polymerase subunit beta' [Cardinium endosymbiont of Oedothorax gibbosus]CAH2560023.1 DNA-directed RNA polymerase subunit beta' [Cardinium endosymbiont of Oedothorax gibbosus]
MKFKKNNAHSTQFSGIIASLSSPEVILSRSSGEVTLPETINYRTHKPETKGLFCERIFGPVKDWECHCGKYKGIRYKGIVCDRCGVEITEKKQRRQRVGHIELVVPVTHIWYFKVLPSKISYLLGLPTKKVEQIIYYERYVVMQPGIKKEDGIAAMDLLSEDEYLDILDQLPADNPLLSNSDPNKFIALIGSEAIESILKGLDLEKLSIYLREQLLTDASQQRRLEIVKRLKIVEGFRDVHKKVENRPEWMVMRILPVIPPELRPLFSLGGGKFATSDLNDLYRRVIIRNNRLKRLLAIKAPQIIIRNEMRMLQEAVDSLFDNSRKVNSVASEGIRPLKSLSDMLKGKQGRFRQNLLGKRVDYSGRSVIVVGPELRLHECGLPKEMAVELFMPFIIRRLIERGVAETVKVAKRLIEEKDPVIWDVLENVLKGHPVLLNRAPTLHRLGIQAFQPKLIEGKAVQLHPLVCTAFNADFDGDQMAVHVPLGQQAIAEASLLMLASYNVLNPSNGIPITIPSRDMILGLHYLTKGKRSTPGDVVLGEGISFYAPEEVLIALAHKKVSKHAYVKLRVPTTDLDGTVEYRLIETTVGRVVFNEYCPAGMAFVNETLNVRNMQRIVTDMYSKFGTVVTVEFLDNIKALGFNTAFKAGMTIGLDDVKVPANKHELIAQATEEVESIWGNYMLGLITDNERYNQVIDVWTRTNTRITNQLMEQLEQDQNGFNSVYMMMISGARGSREQVRQLGGMKGLIGRPQKSTQGAVGEIIEHPIISNFQEGLNVIEYFIATHGARKGLADTALKTADAGYLTRRLVDVAQDLTVVEEDCGTLKGISVTAVQVENRIVEPLAERILGRVVVDDVLDPQTGALLIARGHGIDEQIAVNIEKAGLEEVFVRSVLTCDLSQGVCVKCYGRNLSTGNMVSVGEAVGVIAAQSIGQPGTQLTMRTFHVGGIASNVTVDAKVKAKYAGIINFEDLMVTEYVDSNGQEVKVVMSRSAELQILDPDTRKVLTSTHLPYGAHLKVKNNQIVSYDQELYHWDPYNVVLLATQDGVVNFLGLEEGITYQEEFDEQTGRKAKVMIESRDKTKHPSVVLCDDAGVTIASYTLPVKAQLAVEVGDKVHKGEVLARVPRIINQSRDITGGLPRVVELFEARKPANTAFISELSGVVTYGGIKRGNREIFIQSKEGIQVKYMIPLSKHILVQDNDYVKVGEVITDGAVAAADLLVTKGPLVAQEYIMNELQNVYRLQGEKINNKHIETIIKQMMRKVEVIDPGDTTMLHGQIVDKVKFFEENDKIRDQSIVLTPGDSKLFKQGQFVSSSRLLQENDKLKEQGLVSVEARPVELAIAQPKLQGITQISLATESFLSAASFQETAKVLSDAAVSAKYDKLKGLKENIIVGHLIPAGTGMRCYEKLVVNSKKEYDALASAKASATGG